MLNRQIKHYNSMADMWKHGMDKHGILSSCGNSAIQNGQWIDATGQCSKQHNHCIVIIISIFL
jgi:hypothetical protein